MMHMRAFVNIQDEKFCTIRKKSARDCGMKEKDVG